MNKYKYLFRNIGILAISNFSVQLLAFFLVPLYTSILSTEEYGIYDLYTTTITLLIPVLTIDIQDAVLRFTLDGSKDRNRQVLSYSIRLLLVGAAVVGIFLLLNGRFSFIKIINEYPLYFFFMYLSVAFYQVMQNFAQGLNQVKQVGWSGVICSFVFFVLNIFFLVSLKLGLQGYFLATILSRIMPVIYLSFSTNIGSYISFERTENSLKKSMKEYSAPLIVSQIGWWITSASDRYFVTWFCGVAENGIYSIAYKIPNVLNTVQSLFNQAWVLSSVKEFDPQDKDGFFSNIYCMYNVMMTMACELVILLSRWISSILFANDFYGAWVYIPFLTLGALFGALAQVFNGIYTSVKESKVAAVTTAAGSVTNIILNFILILKLGTIGAAIATFFSYFVVWLIRILGIGKYIQLKLPMVRQIVSYLLLGLQTGVLFLLDESLTYYLVSLVIFVVLVILYHREIHGMLGGMKQYRKA